MLDDVREEDEVLEVHRVDVLDEIPMPSFEHWDRVDQDSVEPSIKGRKKSSNQCFMGA